METLTTDLVGASPSTDRRWRVRKVRSMRSPECPDRTFPQPVCNCSETCLKAALVMVFLSVLFPQTGYRTCPRTALSVAGVLHVATGVEVRN